jgi:hypothetical protein
MENYVQITEIKKEEKKGLNRLTKAFLILALLTMLSMVFCHANAFIFFCSLANIVGIWAIVRHFRTDEI